MHNSAWALVLVLLLLAPVSQAGEAERIDPKIKPFESWLAHSDAVLRAIAAFELRRHAEDGAVLMLSRALARERDDIVLGCLLGSLAHRSRSELVTEGGGLLPGLLVRQVEHRHPMVARRAKETLGRYEAILARDDAKSWRDWWVRHRRKLEEEQTLLLEARAEARRRVEDASTAQGKSRTSPVERQDDFYDHVEQLRRDGLDLVIILDDTGSMAPVIGAATRRAASLVERMSWLVPGFRAGLVTYKDGARVRQMLTTSGEALAKSFRKVGASGGGDFEEGVDQGIRYALKQEKMGWGRRRWRVLVVIGDAPPHEGAVRPLLRFIRSARVDEMYVHPVTVHTVSTTSVGVDHFESIAEAGEGIHVTLGDVARVEEELVALSFGSTWRDRVRPWLAEVRALKKEAPRDKR